MHATKGIFPLPYKFPLTIEDRKSCYFFKNKLNDIVFIYYLEDGVLWVSDHPNVFIFSTLEEAKEFIYNYLKTNPNIIGKAYLNNIAKL